MDDSCGILIQKIIEKYDAPRSVLESSVSDLRPDPPLSNYFADVNKKFPIHTKAAAWVSAAWYVDQGFEIPELEKVLYKTLWKYGMEKEWDKFKIIKKKAQEEEKSTIVLSHPDIRIFALNYPEKFPIHNPKLLCKAAVYFDKNRDNLELHQKFIFSDNCLHNFNKMAGDNWVGLFHSPEVDFETREYIHQKALRQEQSFNKVARDILTLMEIYAGQYLPDYDNWRAKVFSPRIKLASYQNEYEVLSEINECLNKYSSVKSPFGLLEAAENVRKIDLKHFKYPVNDPVMEIALVTKSQSSEVESQYIKSASGAWYKVSDLQKIPASIWAAKFGGNSLIISENRMRELLEDPRTYGECERFLAYHSVYPASGEAACYRTFQLFT